MKNEKQGKEVCFGRVVAGVPHASLGGLADAALSGWPDDARFFNEAVLAHTDLFTDLLFAPDPSQEQGRVVTVRADVSRFVADCERLLHDPMEAQGQGIVYRRYGEFERRVPRGAVSWLAENKWLDYRRRLARAVETAPQGESVLLLDCHSYGEAEAVAMGCDPADLPDVCIGFNDDATCPDAEFLLWLRTFFENAGYSAAFNYPYSNAITPDASRPYRSVMLELNKRTYMDQTHHCLSPAYAAMRRTILRLYRSLTLPSRLQRTHHGASLRVVMRPYPLEPPLDWRVTRRDAPWCVRCGILTNYCGERHWAKGRRWAR